MAAVRKAATATAGSSSKGAASGSTGGQAFGAPFLGVVASARGFQWRERLTGAAINTATAIAQRHGLPELLGRVLAARGIGIDDVPVTLDPTIKALMPDPSTLRDMDKAAARIADAIQAGTPIAIFGDYDVDGASSSALMKRFLLHHGLDARIYIPDRIFEGYGPNPAAIEGLIRDGARLIITVDCGTTSHAALAVAKPKGADVVVVDHHQADAELPDVTAIVNPNRQDDLSGLGHLCAAGVTFMLLVATTRTLRTRGFYGAQMPAPDLLDMLDIVALATVCDVVPLTGLNRAFVTKGLQVMRQRRNIGIRALFDVAALNSPPTPYTLGFVLGPRINAGGRIGDAALGARLLATSDALEAGKIAALLDKLNRERKAIEQTMLDAAMVEAGVMLDATPDLPMLILGSAEWHKGVVGLVASRLVDRYRRPACVISWTADEDGGGGGGGSKSQGTGSLRSVAGVDIGSAIRAAVQDGLLLKGGGHAMAAGLTVERGKMEALQAFMTQRLSTAATRARDTAGLDIDGALTPASVSGDLIDLLERAGPYGQGNPSPRFVFPAHRVKYAKVMGEAHVRVTLEAGDGSKLDGIAFRAIGGPIGDLLLGTGGMPLHVAGQLRRDTWGGREKIELQIEDVADPRAQK
jgi:single-stranded-DNA-specific exonuclease